MTGNSNDMGHEFRMVVEAAHQLSADVGRTIEEILEVGMREPLNPDEIHSLLSRVVEVVRAGVTSRNDEAGVSALDQDTEEFIRRVIVLRTDLVSTSSTDSTTERSRYQLQGHNGIEPRPVRPNPVFHEREVPVNEGFVQTKDIKVWSENERIDIHLNQFRHANDRMPTPDELLDIMLGRVKLPGVTDEDQFEIHELARSIAVNGVRKPPIIDVDGTLLDGNRRVTACHYILDSPDFKTEEKQRVEWLQVWQLTEHATVPDREAVIVSLNFEPDNKQDWPEYVKARKVHEFWQAMLTTEPRANPSKTRQTEIKRQIARRFALSMNEVNRYIQMIDLVDDFEDYHIAERKKDTYAVKHSAERYFQYFDELGKGKSEGGVFWTLNQDEAFKHLVYDLLYDGKFQNWNKIRDLKHVYPNEDAHEFLRRARLEPDPEYAQELVNDGCDLARTLRPEKRQQGANTRVKVFVDWFRNLPVRAFQVGEPDAISLENLKGLHEVLQLVNQHLSHVAEGKKE